MSEYDSGAHAQHVRLLAFGVVLIVLGFLTLALLQYRLPVSQLFPGPIDHPGVHNWAGWIIGRTPPPVPVTEFVGVFRALLLLIWSGYLLVLYSGFRRGLARPRLLVAIAGTLALALAILFPTSLSHDTYAYVGYGRMMPLYHMNPYTHTMTELARLGDSAAVRYPSAPTTPYGPAWTLLSSLVVMLLRGFALPAQVLALKLIAVAALMGGAFAARSIAGESDPARGDLALVAFAFNPLLMLEGPCNGHNDLLMVALMLAGFALVRQPAWRWGYLLIGLSIAVKWATLALVPFLLLQEIRTHRTGATSRVIVATACIVAPVVAFGAPFLSTGSVTASLSSVFGSRLGSESAHDATALVVAAYLAALVWVALGDRDRVMPAWSVWSAPAVVYGIAGVLPWYLTWSTGAAVTQWSGRRAAVAVASVGVGIYWMLYYVTLHSH